MSYAAFSRLRPLREANLLASCPRNTSKKLPDYGTVPEQDFPRVSPEKHKLLHHFVLRAVPIMLS